MTVSRPVYSEATSNDAPNSKPGSRNDGAQLIQAWDINRQIPGWLHAHHARNRRDDRPQWTDKPARYQALCAMRALKNRDPRSIKPG